MAELRHKNGNGIELSAEQSRLVAFLLHPSETDIRDSIDKMAAARRTSQADGKTQPSEVALVSKLQAGDLDSARRQWSEKRDAIPRVASDRVAALLENLAEHRDDLDLETRVASARCSVSYRFGGLEAWAWQLWDRAERPAQRARITSVLAVFRNEPESGVVHRVALRFASVAVDLPAEEYANSAMLVAQQLAESGQPLPPLTLYHESQ